MLGPIAMRWRRNRTGPVDPHDGTDRFPHAKARREQLALY